MNTAEGSKRCPRCEEVKPVHEFHKNKSQPDGLACYCKRCHAWHGSRAREHHRKKFALGLAKVADEKKCRGCKTVKPAAEFSKDASRGNGLAAICKECDTKAYRKKVRHK